MAGGALLRQHWPTTVVDLPGQPGLSDPRRPRRARLAWYGRRLDEVLDVTQMDGVVLVGNSLGAAVALAAGSPRITARLLVSPAGFVRLTVDPKLIGASAAWLLRPTTDRTPSHAAAVRRPGPQRTRDGGGVDDPDGRELPYDPGPAAVTRGSAGRPRPTAVPGRRRRARPVPATTAPGAGGSEHHEHTPADYRIDGSPDHARTPP
ncbi:alpha/beta fold hydrolase [Catellatospora chokoriensis]|uniref:alpha/beta fold hydrolase n=1 Tax=Catellatospora chokoriensis TaxID=310353 RepID=UPI003570BC81